MARRLKQSICKQDVTALDVIFAASADGYTNATLVPMGRLHMLMRKGIIRYEDIPGFHDRYGIYGWRVELTQEGERLYHPPEDQEPAPSSVH